MKREKRISFSGRDAVHIYEWLVMYWQGEVDAQGKPQRFGGCYTCEQLGKRLEAFIGPKDVKMVRDVVEKNPQRKRPTS